MVWAVQIVRTAEGEWKLYLYLDPVVWFVAFYSSEETDIVLTKAQKYGSELVEMHHIFSR